MAARCCAVTPRSEYADIVVEITTLILLRSTAMRRRRSDVADALVALPPRKRARVLALAAYFISGFERSRENVRRAIRLALLLV